MTKWAFSLTVSHVKARLFFLFLQLIASYHPGKSQYSTALRVTNQPKNRSPDLLSTDSARVFLNPGGEMDGDDYINASWLMGKFSFFKTVIRIIWDHLNTLTTIFPPVQNSRRSSKSESSSSAIPLACSKRWLNLEDHECLMVLQFRLKVTFVTLKHKKGEKRRLPGTVN